MSGFKRMIVSINPEEVRNILRFPRRIKNNRQTLQNQNQLQTPEAVIPKKALDDLYTRQTNFNELLGGFQVQLQNLEHSNQLAVDGCREQLLSEMKTTYQGLLNESQLLLQEKSEQLEHQMQSENRRMMERIDENNDQLNQLMQEKERQAPLVEEWLQAAGDLYYYIQENYPLDPITDKLLERTSNELFLAARNQADGMLDAALVTSQQAFRDLSLLRVDCEQRENERLLKYQQVAALAGSLVRSAEEQRFCSAVDLQGCELDYEIDVDYWSKRKLSRLIEKANRLVVQINHDDMLPGDEVFEHMLEEQLPSMMAELEQLVKNARLAAISSQLRLNIADIVVQAMESQGFGLESSDYFNRDMRRDYRACMQNLEGNQLIIQIAPLAGEELQNDLQIESFDQEQRTEHELRQRTLEIKKALGSHGLNIGSVQCRTSFEKEPVKHLRLANNALETRNGFRQPVELTTGI